MIANVLYITALILGSPWIVYRAIRHGRYRRGVAEKLLGLSPARAAQITATQLTAAQITGEQLTAGESPSDRQPLLWLHAVSVGEVNLLGGLVRQLKRRCPGHTIAISTSTDTGYDLAVKLFGPQHVFFCPLDFSWAVRRTIRALRPTQLVLAELELWPNLIRIAKAEGVTVNVINGRLSERSAGRYQQFGRLTRATFARLDWVGCQDEPCRDRFAACGTPADRLQVTGSIKFDDAPESRDSLQVQTLTQWAGIDPWHRVWIAGSTGPGEEQMVLEIYQSLRQQHPELRLILVPRHKERFDQVAAMVDRSGLRVHRRSSDRSLYDHTWDSDTVILVDTIGELRHWWGTAQIAFVGGSFGTRGGQNMLEPAGYGCAVSFGPDTRNFQQIASQLLAGNGAVRVSDEAELAKFVKRCLDDIPAADTLGRAAQRVIQRHRGAINRTIHQLAPKPHKTDSSCEAKAA